MEAATVPEEQPTPTPNASQHFEKPKIIRNRDVDKAAAALAGEHVLPLPPGKKISFDQMRDYLALLTPAMWDNVSIYLYRIKPKIRRQLKNPQAPNYIDCIGQPFDENYIIARHGGGNYLIQAVNMEAKREQDARQLFKCYFTIDDIQHPPILNYEELELEAPENKSYIQWLRNKGILDDKGNMIQPSTPPPASNNGLTAKDVLDILSYTSKLTAEQQNLLRSKIAPDDSLSKSVGEILLEKMKQDDPAKQMQVVTGLLTAFQQIMGTSKPDSSIAGVYDKLIQMQIEQRKADAEQRKNEFEWIKLLLVDREKNTNQFAQFRDVFGFAREIMQASGGAGRRSGWDVAYDVGRDIGLPLIQTLGTTISNIMALRRNGVPTVPNPPGMVPPAAPAGAFDPYRDQQALRAHSQALAAQQPQPQPQPPPPPPPAPGNNELVNLLSQYGGLVINALNSGTRGFDFADYVAGLLGVATHATIAGQGEDTLVTTMLSIPELAIFGEPRLRTFAHEFCHYQEFLEADEEEPAEEDPEKPIEVYRPAHRR
jgi:hypothetical protein